MNTAAGITAKMPTGCGDMCVTINWDAHGICGVIVTLSKAGGCASSMIETLSALISFSLRAGVDAKYIIAAIKGIRCPSLTWHKGKPVLSCIDAIAIVLEKQATNSNAVINAGEACPDCQNPLTIQSGACRYCRQCGWEKCG